jgi:hypothetical protein
LMLGIRLLERSIRFAIFSLAIRLIAVASLTASKA